MSQVNAWPWTHGKEVSRITFIWRTRHSVVDEQTAQPVCSQHKYTLINEKGFRIEKHFLVLCEWPHSTTEKSHGKIRFQIHWVNINVTERAMEDEEQQKQTNPSSVNENSNGTKHSFTAKNIMKYVHSKELGRIVPSEGTKALWFSCCQPRLQISCGIFQGTSTKSQIQNCKFQDS